MPIGAPIPMPQNGMDAFYQGMEKTQNIFDSISKNKYNQGQLGVAQAESARAQTLLPYMIQKYKDAHDLSPLERDHLRAQIASAYAMANLHKSNAGLNELFLGGSGGGASANQNIPVQTPSQNVPVDTNGMSRHDLVGHANADQARSDENMGINPASSQNMANRMLSPGSQQIAAPSGPPNQNVAQPNQISSPPPQQPIPPINKNEKMPNENKILGEEEIVKPAAPGMENLDKFAERGGHTDTFAPKITRGPIDQNGNRFTYYPSGKITRQKVAPSFEEKEEMKASNAEKKNEAKVNKAESVKLESSAGEMIKSAKILKEMNDLLIKNKGLTSAAYAIPLGIGHGLKKVSNSAPLTKFSNLGGALQGIIAKNTTGSRTGVGALNWAKLVKPSEEQGVDANFGSIQANAELLKSAFEEDKKSWEHKNPGKKYPYEFPDLSEILSKDYNQGSDIKVVDGKTYKLINGDWHVRK